MDGRSKKRGGMDVHGGDEEENATGEEEGRNGALPTANIVRLMRQVLPRNVKISSTAKEITRDCAVEFVGFVTGAASERARSESRRTVAPQDFTWSFGSIGLDRYVEPMQAYLRGYQEFERAGGRSGAARDAPPSSSHGAPMVTDEELEFLRSVVPPPPGGY